MAMIMVLFWWLVLIWTSKAQFEGRRIELNNQGLRREQYHYSGFGTEAQYSPSLIEAPSPLPTPSSSLRDLPPSLLESHSSAVHQPVDSRINIVLDSTTTLSSSARPTIHPKRPPHEGTTPKICKTVVGDVMWPPYDVWKSYMPNVTEMWIEGNEAHPNYFLIAKNIADVEAAVAFSVKYNIRLSVVSSGNDAPNGLMVSVKYMKGIEILENPDVKEEGFAEVKFADDSATTNVVSLSSRSRYAVSVGAGITTQELNDALEPSKLFSVAAAHGNITVAGGWLQGGGHGPFSYHRLAIDEVLEFQVVTGDGQLKIANQVSNPDLFWALKGGGGATFGIVVQATVNAWPDSRRSLYSAWLNLTASAPDEAIYNIAPHCFKEVQRLSFLQGYCFIYPNAIRILGWTHPGGSGEDRSKRSSHKKEWLTSLRELENDPYVAPIIHEEISYASFKEFFDGTFGMRNQARYESDDKCKRKNEWFPETLECSEGPGITARDLAFSHRSESRHDLIDPHPVGITKVDSWLLAREHLVSKKLPTVLKASMPRYDNETIMSNVPLAVHFTHNSVVGESWGGNSMHSAWRSSEALVSGTNLTALRAFAPYMAAYLNEASFPYENFKRAFWGDTYDRLLNIKRKYDPKDVFFVTPGIGADEWWVDAARLCRHERRSDQEAFDPLTVLPVEGVLIDPVSDVPTSTSEILANVSRHVELQTHQETVTHAPQSQRTLRMPFSKSTVIVVLPPPDVKGTPTAITQGALTTLTYTFKTTPAPTSKPNTVPVISLADLKTMTNTTSTIYTLPYPEGDNTNTNPSPLAKFLLPGPFVTPWPSNQAAADNFQRSALARLSTMRESSLREKGFSQFGYSYLAPGMPLPRPTTTPTAYVPINVTPKMPAWSPGNDVVSTPVPQFTTVSADSFSADYKATTTTGPMSSWSGPIKGTSTASITSSASSIGIASGTSSASGASTTSGANITNVSSSTSGSSVSIATGSSSSSGTSTASRPKGPTSVSGPGGRPPSMPKPKSPALLGTTNGGRLIEDVLMPKEEETPFEDVSMDEYFVFSM